MSNQKCTVWITGNKGFLGGELEKRLTDAGYVVVGTASELSVTEPERLEAFAQQIRPDVIINSAGIPRAVIGLNNRIKAYEINALGAKNMAVVANVVGAHLIQISTDDVFPIRMAEPANEFDAPHPSTPYGKSKLAGERMVRDIADSFSIIRTSWLYGSTGGMLKEALLTAKKGGTVKVRADQYASPTSIELYARFIDKVIEHRPEGVLHIASQGTCSRYEFESKALELCGYDPSKVLVPETDLVTAEQVLLESLMLEMFGADLPTWQEDLASFLKNEGLIQ